MLQGYIFVKAPVHVTVIAESLDGAINAIVRTYKNDLLGFRDVRHLWDDHDSIADPDESIEDVIQGTWFGSFDIVEGNAVIICCEGAKANGDLRRY